MVRPNADTLYSILWFDLAPSRWRSACPIPAGATTCCRCSTSGPTPSPCPGSRTTGDGEQLIVLAGPRWQGKLPPGAMLIRSPTAIGWIIGRTQTNGAADYANVHRFQAGLTRDAVEPARPGRRRRRRRSSIRHGT